MLLNSTPWKRPGRKPLPHIRWEIGCGGLDDPPAPAAVAVERFRQGQPILVRKAGKRGERVVDARSSLVSLSALGPARLAIEIAVAADGTLRPGAVAGALLDLSPDSISRLRVHKVATRFRPAAPEPTALAAAR